MMDQNQSKNLTDLGVEITELAKDRIINLTKDSAAVGLRIGIQGGGCSGFEYVCSLTRKTVKDDTVFFKDSNYQVIMDAKSMFFLAGLVIDYNDGLTGAGFTFGNPNATGTCGCGTSFSV
jgi:iron-sulfur cluster assembly protein